MLNGLKSALPINSQKLNNFFYSPFFPSYIGILCVACYTLNTPLIGLAIMAFFACILLIIYRDLCPFMCLPFLVIMLFRDINDIVNVASVFILFPVAVCLVLHFIIYPPKCIFKGKLVLPFLLISITLFTGGLFSQYITEYHKSIVFSVASGPVLLFAYLLFYEYVTPTDSFDLKKYVCQVLLVVGFVATTQTAIHKFYIYEFFDYGTLLPDEIGWNNANGIASLLLVCVSCCAYLLCTAKKVIPTFIAFMLLCAGVFITDSVGCIGALIISMPIMLYFTIKKANKQNKRSLLLLYLLTFAIIIIGIGLYIYLEGLGEVNEYIKTNLSHDHGRTALIKEGWALFKKYPIFGVSMGYVNPDTKLKVNSVVSYNFHSTPFHILATMGVVGFVAYTYYYVQRYKLLMHNDSAFNTFAFIGFSIFQAYGFIDTCEFNVIPCMLILTIFFAILERLNEKSNEKPLPLKSLY